MKKVWFDEEWQDYIYWQTQDKKTLKRVNNLLKDIERGYFEGIGKP
jgi:toxin YoeB